MPDSSPGGVVIDTSVLLNVIATDIPRELLRAFGLPACVPRTAHKEVLRDPRDRSNPGRILDLIIAEGLLTIAELDVGETETFLTLVSAPSPDDLDDGEAAVIACAYHRSFAVAIDETKAIRILRSQFPRVRHFFSVDLFDLARDKGLVSAALAAQAFEDAKRYARMRVPHRKP
jgi:hypothetical protein